MLSFYFFVWMDLPYPKVISVHPKSHNYKIYYILNASQLRQSLMDCFLCVFIYTISFQTLFFSFLQSIHLTVSLTPCSLQSWGEEIPYKGVALAEASLTFPDSVIYLSTFNLMPTMSLSSIFVPFTDSFHWWSPFNSLLQQCPQFSLTFWSPFLPYPEYIAIILEILPNILYEVPMTQLVTHSMLLLKMSTSPM